jgi:hypothetical protein
MKVICVTTEYSGNWSSFSSKLMLTVGKWYDVEGEGTDYYTIIWKNGYQANLNKSYFKTVEELRDVKLSQIGI